MNNKKFRKNESGAIFLEATMIISIVLIVLCAMLGLGFFIYQKSMLNTIATETANYAANNYKYSKLSKIDTPEVPEGKLTDLEMYRSYKSLLKNSKISNYAKKRCKKTSFTDDAITVKTAKLIRDSAGRKRVKITLKMHVSIVFENIMVGIGLIDSNPSITATAYAECLDYTDYSSQVFFINYLQDQASNTNMGKIANNSAGMIDDVIKIIDIVSK